MNDFHTDPDDLFIVEIFGHHYFFNGLVGLSFLLGRCILVPGYLSCDRKPEILRIQNQTDNYRAPRFLLFK